MDTGGSWTKPVVGLHEDVFTGFPTGWWTLDQGSDQAEDRVGGLSKADMSKKGRKFFCQVNGFKERRRDVFTALVTHWAHLV